MNGSRRRRIRASLVVSAIAAFWLCAKPAIAQPQYETVHEFIQGPGQVYGRLVQAIDGNLYGVTRDGGAYSGGTIFVLRRSGGTWLPALTVHDFRPSEGTQPIGGLIAGSLGQLYGTTSIQGAFGGGSVYRISIFGGFQVLASLNPSVHGANPITELTRGADLNFYGTAVNGGPRGAGTVFRITPAGTLTLLHAFGGDDGAQPAGALALTPDGNLYGTTWSGGGLFATGTLYRIARTGAFTSLLSFGPFELSFPFGRLTLATDGALYGTASKRLFDLGGSPYGGAVFRFTLADNTATPLLPRDFRQMGAGAGLTQSRDGWLYGTSDGSSVYRIRPETLAFEWVALNVNDPSGIGTTGNSALIEADDGRFYMGTSSGGAGRYGTVFSTDSAGDLRVHHSFRSDGFHPISTLLPDDNGLMYGSTYSGGADTFGSYFALSAGGLVEPIATHPPSHGRLMGDLVPYPTGFLASTDARIMHVVDGNVTMLWQSAPTGAPVRGLADGVIYATTYFRQFGAVVRADSNDDAEVLHWFEGTDGALPRGLIESGDGVFYGVTQYGGAFDQGTVFSVKRDGTFATLHHFSGADGKWPVATLSLTSTEDGLALIGTTTAGGNMSASADGAGTIFRVSIDGSSFRTLHAFAAGEGILPYAAVRPGFDGRVYGTTVGGGLGFGTIYAVSTDGAFETLHRFAPGEGAFPLAGVTPVTDGEFHGLYGTTVFGGRANVGTIFRLRLARPQ